MNQLLLLILAVCQYGNAKMLVTVYYESKCSDSSQFMKEQLEPALELLHNHIELRLFPFGKAHSEEDEDGCLQFNCQHGSPECLGNMVQECTLYHMQDRTDIEKLSYVNCEMAEMSGTTGDMTCVQNANVPVEWVQDCIKSDEGIQLQLISEKATKQLNPDFIPTVTINNVFDQEIQDKCMEDLVGTLCSMIEEDSPCAAHHSHAE